MKPVRLAVLLLLCSVFFVSDSAPVGGTSKYGLSDEQVAGFEEAFKKFDTNRNGKIEKAELRDGMKSLGQQLTETELEDLMKSVGKEENETIDLDLFLQLMAASIKPEKKKLDEKALRDAFHLKIDINNDGLISPSDIRAFKQGMGEELTEEEAEEIFKAADQDGDGKISYLEFIMAMIQGDGH